MAMQSYKPSASPQSDDDGTGDHVRISRTGSYPSGALSPMDYRQNDAATPQPPNFRKDQSSKPQRGDDMHKNDDKKWGQNPDFKHLYYQQPPARSRRPYILKNKNNRYIRKHGIVYKSIACIRKVEAELFDYLWQSEALFIMLVLALIYHYRMNIIERRGALSDVDIAGIFDTDLCDFQFSICEIFKRYSMRRNALGNRNAAKLNFWALPAEAVKAFEDHLMSIGSFHKGGQAFTLWSIHIDNEGKHYLKLRPCEFVLNYFQLFNSVHDSLYQWRTSLYGEEWIKHQAPKPPFYICLVINLHL